MNRALWTVQALLAALFIFAGGMKLVLPIEEMTREIALPGALLRVVGLAELAGGLGLVLPALTGIRTGLVPLAAMGLSIIMIGAVVLSAMIGGLTAALPALVAGVGLAFVAYGRWYVLPHGTSSASSTVVHAAR